MSPRPAAEIELPRLTRLFNDCYSDYFVPVHLTEESFSAMVRLFDLDLGCSRVIEADGEPAAFALLGVRGERGWIGGMGTVPSARRRGLGLEAMVATLGTAWERGLLQVELEVLVENVAAAGLYERLGFRERRRLEVWVRPAQPRPPELPAGLQALARAVEPLPLARCLALRLARSGEPLPWQRDIPVMRRQADQVAALGLRSDSAIAAWAVLRAAPEALQLLDLGAEPGAPPAALTAVLAAALLAHPDAAARLLNLPAGDPTAAALATLGFQVRHRQREMVLDLAL